MNTSLLTQPLDLNAYFRRIGYTGPHSATLEVLQTLQALHPQTIPFENLDPFLSRPVLLDLASIQAKLVHSQRGGYCYEHNLLFARVLDELGFAVFRLAARVLWNQPEGALRPRTHMLLKVQINNRPYIADVGFGGNTLTAPLRLDIESTQDTPHGAYRLLHAHENFVLQAYLQNEWRKIYQFDLQEQLPIDYEAVNYYLSTHHASHWRHALYAALVTPAGRYNMLNGRLTVRRTDSTVERTEANCADEAADLLLKVFGIRIPDCVAFKTAWNHLRQDQPARDSPS